MLVLLVLLDAPTGPAEHDLAKTLNLGLFSSVPAPRGPPKPRSDLAKRRDTLPPAPRSPPQIFSPCKFPDGCPSDDPRLPPRAKRPERPRGAKVLRTRARGFHRICRKIHKWPTFAFSRFWASAGVDGFDGFCECGRWASGVWVVNCDGFGFTGYTASSRGEGHGQDC